MALYMLGSTTYNVTLGPLRNFRSSSASTTEWRFGASGVRQDWDGGSIELPWSAFRRLVVTEEFLLLYRTRQIGQAFPRRVFSESDLERIRGLASTNHPTSPRG